MDVANHEDARSVLRAMIAPVDEDRFSSIATQSGEVRFFEEGKALGYGMSTAFFGDELTITDVLGDPGSEDPSSAATVGLLRGDRITAIEGEAVAVLVEAGRLGEAFGPFEPDVTRTFTILNRQGGTRDVALTTSFFSIVAVPVVEIIATEAGPVGYVVLRNFTEPANGELVDAFETFERQGVRRVVVDLRYNGGGLISTANLLADLMVGRTAEGEIFTQNRFNERNRACDGAREFERTEAGLDRLDSLVFITLRSTASASELLINGMRPWTRVRTVGNRTFGKPVGQLGFRFCEKVLRPITFQILNADGFGDYFEGIAPTCMREDDPTLPFGDPGEGMLGDALSLLESGRCPEAPKRRQPLPVRHVERPFGPFELRRVL